MNPKLLLCLALVLNGGLFGCSTTAQHNHSAKQDFLLSFPNRLGSGEQVVGFELHIQNGKILAVNQVPYDWIISLLVEAPGSEMGGLPNHDASAFQDMTPLQRFVTIRKGQPPFDVTGYFIVTKDFVTEQTNFLTASDFIEEEISSGR
jgi:hypothetical protein